MSKLRVLSSPQLAPSSSSPPPPSPLSQEYYEDSALEGVAANVKLLLKLIQDHKDACYKHKNDGRRMLRVATMMTILDNVRNRIQKCQFGNKRSEAELRRCNTDPKQQQQVHSPKTPPTDQRRRGGGVDESSSDEHEKLKKALNASLAARKSLEIMCSSLGKEKEIMSAELAKKVHEVNEMDEMINDLRAQNETLSEKLKQYASEPRRENMIMMSGGQIVGAETHGYAILQERNRALSDHLQRSLDGYRSLKRKLREAVEENLQAQSTMEEMVGKVQESLTRFHSFKGRIASSGGAADAIEGEIVHLEEVFDLLQMKVATKSGHKKVDCGKQKSEPAISPPFVTV